MSPARFRCATQLEPRNLTYLDCLMKIFNQFLIITSQRSYRENFREWAGGFGYGEVGTVGLEFQTEIRKECVGLENNSSRDVDGKGYEVEFNLLVVFDIC